jgi:hypothetical protein
MSASYTDMNGRHHANPEGIRSFSPAAAGLARLTEGLSMNLPPNPEGVPAFSPGLARFREGLPWVVRKNINNPERVGSDEAVASGGANGIPISLYPAIPDLPAPGEPVLIRVPASMPRPAARLELRSALRAVLAAWTGLDPARLPLRETPRGPVWSGAFLRHPLDISLSYGEHEGWIALMRGGRIGVDAMLAAPIAEMDDVARLYLGPDVAVALRTAPDRELAFALAWTELEARIKCFKRGLSEWPGSEVPGNSGWSARSQVLPGRIVVSVVTAAAG